MAQRRGARPFPIDHPSFPFLADHFVGAPVLPGSLQIELCAQIAGPLAEEVTALQHATERWAFLGLVRHAAFLEPAVLPARLVISAQVKRAEPSSVAVATSLAREDGEMLCRAELVMAAARGGRHLGRGYSSVPRARGGLEGACPDVKAHVVIIGAGPAGLAAAVSLSKRGVSCSLLERGGTAAAGLRRVDPEMRLFSPARLSRLPGMRLEVGKPPYPTFGQFLDALDAYRTEHAIEVITGAEATQVERTSEGFVVHARVGAEARSLPASHVINATGIVSAPKLPADFDPVHEPASVDPQPRRAGRSHLDGGAPARRGRRRLRGGGARYLVADAPARRASRHLAALTAAGDTKPDPGAGRALSLLAARASSRAPDRSLGGAQGRHVRLCGAARHSRRDHRARPGRGALRRRRRAPEPGQGRRSRRNTLKPDLLVFATGFIHQTDHLGDLVERDRDGWPRARRCESTRAPRLYLLGTRFVRTLASPYLRGIGRDAAFVARRIARDQ